MANLFIPSGTSNSPIPVPSRGAAQFRSSVGDPPPSPDHISGAVQAGGNILTYPLDRPKYFMHFGIYEYHRESLLTVGQLNPWSRGISNQIALPMSETLVDTMEERWEAKPIPWIVGGIVEGIGALKQQQLTMQQMQNASAQEQIDAANKIKQGRLDSAKAAGLATFTSLPVVGDTISALTGVSPNQFVTILFVGPEYKQFTFQWNFSPRNAQESERLRQIINTFKMAMAPSLEYSVLWGYPCIFKLLFRPNNEQLYKFRPSVLKRFTANWTPLGRASFHASGVNAPEGCTVQATFLELEYWFQSRNGGVGNMSVTPSRATSLDSSNASDF